MKKVTLISFFLGLMLAVQIGNLHSQNYALRFDGTNDKVGILDHQTLNPNGAMTLELWIHAEHWAGSIWGACLIGKQGTNPDKGYALTVGENGRIEFNHSINQAWKAVQTTPILGLNTWYHIAGVFDGSTLKLYVNGVLQATANASGTQTLGTGVVMNLGDNPTWPGRFFRGSMDEIRIWNVARTESQIQEFMSVELTGSESGLAAYWNMNEGEGTTIQDRSSNNNNGTLLNFGDGAWVQGFSPMVADLGILGIAAPSAIGAEFSGEEHVKLDIKNFATSSVSAFSMSYQINGGDVVTETVEEPLAAFESGIFTFSTPVDLAGFNVIEVKAWVTVAEDGNISNDTLVATITKTLEFPLFYRVQHNFSSAGQTHFRTVYMPENLDNISNITLSLDLRCPAGGCDPWDQPGMLYVIIDGIEYEIIRYVTPYGRACGGWSFDLTDFKPMLTGKTVFKSLVQVWGASGWLVDINLEFSEGEPAYFVRKVDPLWNTNYWVYGDPAISYDLPAVTLPILAETDAAVIRMTVSGHGQGNTQNAAEFSEFTHHVWIDGTETFPMHLWKSDCNVNPCSPQNGTWQYARAGWCPGQDIQPWIYNLQNHFTPGQDIDLDFVLANYTNLLNTGYNNSSHTEPYYRIHGYLVQYERNPNVFVEEEANLSNTSTMSVFPNPTNGMVEVQSQREPLESIRVFNLDGRKIIDMPKIESQNVNLDFSNQNPGMYFIEITSKGETNRIKLVRQ
jgi:hypothetical protein